MMYHATVDSLSAHCVPNWFHDAKFGIFIHWGLYSVPGWAQPSGDVDEIVEQQGWEAFFRNMPYAEWYQHSMHFPGSPTERYHHQTYGANFAYERFAETFNQEIQQWNPVEWAALFKDTGARYVVLTTRHSDSFALWETRVPHPSKGVYAARRDLVGELTHAVREANMRMGFYYCGGMDWLMEPDFLVRDHPDLMGKMPQSQAYNDYINAQWRELIDRYRPDIMWNDIGWPRDSDPKELMAYFYNQVPDGVINDRFAQDGRPGCLSDEEELLVNPKCEHYDFRTPEYTSYKDIQDHKWELCRGIGHSFGYNRLEDDSHYLKPDALIHLLVDVVSKNGNLLLNVGPEADGTIPPIQKERLHQLGAWLAVNGECIYGSRPLIRAERKTEDGIDIRFTQTDDAIYAILLAKPESAPVRLDDIPAYDETKITLLGHEQPLDWTRSGDQIEITLPGQLEKAYAYALKIEKAGFPVTA